MYRFAFYPYGVGIKKLSIAVLVALLMGCATPYQSRGLSGGYKDKETSPGVFELSFIGNGVTSFSKVEEYWHRRAAELCPNGYVVLSMDDTSGSATTSAAVGSTYVPVSVSYPQMHGIILCNKQVDKSPE